VGFRHGKINYSEFRPLESERLRPSFQSDATTLLRAIASLTKECVNFDVCRVSAGGLIRNVSDENASRFGFASEQPSIAVRAAVEFPIVRGMYHF